MVSATIGVLLLTSVTLSVEESLRPLTPENQQALGRVISDLIAPLGGSDVLAVKMRRVGSRIQVTLTRVAGSARKASEEVFLGRHPASWKNGALQDAVTRLFPGGQAAPLRTPPIRAQPKVAPPTHQPPAEPGTFRKSGTPRKTLPLPRMTVPKPEKSETPLLPQPLPEAKSSNAPWFLMGTSIVLAGVGAVFAVRTADALSQLPAFDENALTNAATLPEELRAQQEEVLGNGLAANMLLSIAAAGLVTSTYLLLTE